MFKSLEIMTAFTLLLEPEGRLGYLEWNLPRDSPYVVRLKTTHVDVVYEMRIVGDYQLCTDVGDYFHHANGPASFR